MFGSNLTPRRVVVTGIGIVSPVGNDTDTAWKNILDGKSGITRIEKFDASLFSVRIAGEIRDFDVTQYLTPKEARKMDGFMHFGIAAGVQALKDCGLEPNPKNADRMGVHIGSGIGGIDTIQRAQDIYAKGGPRKISPFFVPSAIINMVAGNLSIMYGLRGPNLSMVTACTTGTHSIGEAGRMIALGDADVMVAGGAENAETVLGIGGFASAPALSTRNDETEKASRPFDLERDGFVLGDGAGVLVLEEYEHAKARGARMYCELAGFGMSADAHHMTQPMEDGDGAMRCMHHAMQGAGVNADEIDYINAHGTSTPLGDLAETIGIKRALGDHAYKTAISSTKSMTGHLLGAAGGVEAAFTALAVRDQVAPPTINLDTPDPKCDLDYVPNSAREMKINVAISNSFGFGGTNGTLVFRRI